jgi:hypothetical protein
MIRKKIFLLQSYRRICTTFKTNTLQMIHLFIVVFWLLKKAKTQLQHIHVMFLPFSKEAYKLSKVYKELFINSYPPTIVKRDISFISYPGVITNLDSFIHVNK